MPHASLLATTNNALAPLRTAVSISMAVRPKEPDEDVEELKQMGVAEILGQDTPPDAVVETVRRLMEERGARV